MAINYGANYTGIDKERYDAGNQFYSQDRFLQGTGLDKPAITFNPSNYDTGITSQYGKNSMYGTPNQGSDSMGATMPTGNFNQKSITDIQRLGQTINSKHAEIAACISSILLFTPLILFWYLILEP